MNCKVNYIVTILLIIFIVGCGQAFKKQEAESRIERDVNRHIPLKPVTEHSLQSKWEQKEILKEKVVDNMESLENWQGKMVFTTIANPKLQPDVKVDFSLSENNVFESAHSIKLKTATKSKAPMQPEQRFWEWIFLTRKFDHEDFSEYTRISAKIFPDCPGHKKIHLLIILHNANFFPDKYAREGMHTVMLENNKWNNVIFEIPHLQRDDVTGISFVYRQQGNEIDASDTVEFYFDRLALQTAKTEHIEGWNTENEISFSHTGYNCYAPKTAVTSILGKKTFKLISHPGNKIILEKEVTEMDGTLGKFSVLDFSEVEKPGKYKLAYNNVVTKPFPVKKDAWRSTLLKTINFFFCQRCGFEVPGVHGVCHSDWYTVTDNDTVFLNGGWHDAGDLSQSFTNTAEATAAMFRLAGKLKDKDPKLSDRLTEEAMWGLKWLHKNRFDDTKKVSWTVIDHWSDGIVGNGDDKLAFSEFNVRDNRFSVVAEVEAMKALKTQNPELAEKCMEYAKEDWFNTESKIHSPNVATLARGIWAGSVLFEATKNEDVKKTIISYADELMKCQQKKPMDWEIPLCGFFYTNSESDIIYVQRHVVSIISPILGLVELCKLFPEHEKYHDWYSSIELYAEYLKTVSSLTAPYYIFPASVYKLGSNDNEQIKKGIPMNEEYYLRMFPVWEAARGNSPIILSQAIGLAQANKILKDKQLNNICQSQLEWIVGKNPFNQSLMYGEGYDYSPLYSAPSGDIVGGIPVGIQTRGNSDIPYWQPAVLYNFKETWVHVSSRWLYLLESLYYF
ncbi:MAG: glycoside hydrolase family 9 protein [Bacteroidota bacterium]